MTDKNTAGVDLDKPEQALEVITSRLALTYRICCGLAPKQAVGELLDVAINMPEWEIVRAALRQTAPEAPTYVLSEGELKRLRRVLTLLGVAGSEELDTETSMACLWSLMQELIRKLEAAPAPAAQQAEAAPGEKFASSAVRMQQFIGATTASASERNQCDGCAQGASTNERGNHIDANGRPFMSCQSHRYRAPAPSQDAAPEIKTWQDRYNEMGEGTSFNDKSVAMMAEIADLRAQLAAKGQREPVVQPANAAIATLRKYWEHGGWNEASTESKGDEISQALTAVIWGAAPASAQPDRGAAQDDKRDAERYRALRAGNDYAKDGAPMVLLYEKGYDDGQRPYWVISGEVLDNAADALVAAPSPASQPVAPETAPAVVFLRQDSEFGPWIECNPAHVHAVRFVRADSAVAPSDAKDATVPDHSEREAANAGGLPVDADELAFNATRLRNVARLVGLESAIPQDDATLDGARGSVLGLIAGTLRNMHTAKPTTAEVADLRRAVMALPQKDITDGEWTWAYVAVGDVLAVLDHQSPATIAAGQEAANAKDAARLHGFDRDDLEAIADGLEAGYEKSVDVGGSPFDGDGRNLIESTTSAAARFIRAAMAAAPSSEKGGAS